METHIFYTCSRTRRTMKFNKTRRHDHEIYITVTNFGSFIIFRRQWEDNDSDNDAESHHIANDIARKDLTIFQLMWHYIDQISCGTAE